MYTHVCLIVTCGLLLSVNSQIDPAACGTGQSRDIRQDSGSISISYISKLNDRCQWHVYPETETTTKVAVMTVEYLWFENTQCQKSYLHLYDNVNTLPDELIDNRCEPIATANETYTRISKSSSFTVQFLDVSVGWDGGLLVHFKFIEPSSDTIACGFGGPSRVIHKKGEIMSPGPEVTFPMNNMKCKWRIEGDRDEYIHLELATDAVMRLGDSVTLYDGRSNTSVVLTTWHKNTEFPAVKWNGGPYMYIEFNLGPAEDIIHPLVTLNFESIKTYEWACNRKALSQGPPAYLTQVNDIVLELPDYNEIGQIALNCRWSIVSHPGWIVAASIQNFTLGATSGTCSPDTAPLLTLGPNPESYLCGSVGSALLNHSFPSIEVTLDVPVSTRLDTDYYIMQTSGKNITAIACEDPFLAVLTNQPGLISNTDYPSATASSQYCTWHLEAPVGWFVRLKVLHYIANCRDSDCGFYVYDRNDELEFIHKNVAFEDPVIVHSSSNLMRLQYKCPCSSPSETTFFIYFSFQRTSEICDPDVPIVLTEEEGLISSPGYEQGTYPRESHCQWLIQPHGNSEAPFKSIVIEFIDLDLRTDDEVVVRDGPSSASFGIGFFRGKNVQPAPMVATNQTSAFIQLKSVNNYGAARGFSLRYYVTTDPYAVMACTEKTRPTLVYDASSSIMSPGYPDRFPTYQHCTWRLDVDESQMTELEIVDIDLGIQNCLDVIAGNQAGENKSVARFCDSDSATGNIVFVAAPHAFINFTSEYNTNRGFNITHRSLQRHEKACQLNGTPVGVHLAVSDYIRTPELDNSRSNLVKCRWYFTASIHEVIRFESIYYDLGYDCSHSNLELLDYTSIGNQEVVRDSGCGYPTYKTVWIGPVGAMAEFHTHVEPNSEPITGFKASVTFHNITAKACGAYSPVLVNWAPGYIVSPNYGEGYYPPTTVLPNRCSWRVQTDPGNLIQLYFEDFDVGDPASNCINEYLEILDGSSIHRLCGFSDPGVWTSEGLEVVITLYAPLYNNFKRGFKIVYSFEEGPDESSSNSAFIGMVAGVVLFVCITIVAIVITYAYYQKKKTQRNEEQDEQPEEVRHSTAAPYDINLFMQAPEETVPGPDSQACSAPPSYGDVILQGGSCQSLAGTPSLTGADAMPFTVYPDSNPPSYEESLQHNPPGYYFKQC